MLWDNSYSKLSACKSAKLESGDAPTIENIGGNTVAISFSHIDLLVDMDNETKRSFYEIKAIRGNWSVREP